MKSSLLRSARPRIVLFVAALAVLAVVAWFIGSREPQAAESPLVCADDAASLVSPLFSKRMEDVALVSMQRSPVMLSELAGEHFTVGIFCSYKCPCSDGYIGRLRDLRKRYEPRGVSFIAINASADENLDGLAQYIQRKDYPLPVFRDEMSAAADQMYASVTPEVFVFDTAWALQYHGRIDDDKSGLFVEEESLRLALDTLLAGKTLRDKEKISLGCAIVRTRPLGTDASK
ncbi:MAG: redoxin domain-containing protein [Bacteroidetes bacterium]|nr:redoxin domain-containing protein [Bacteroidota bacterium]